MARNALWDALAPLAERGRIGIAGALPAEWAPPAATAIPRSARKPVYAVLVGTDRAALTAASRTALPGAVFVQLSALAIPLPDAPHAAHLLLRQVQGALLVEPSFPAPRAVLLHGAAEALLHLFLWSDEPLPGLPTGLYEGAAPAFPVPESPPAFLPRLLRPGPARDTALRFARRLVEVEAEGLARAGSRAAADAAVRTVASAARGFEPPSDRHPWPRAEAPDRQPGLYDARPDDPVIDEAAAGERFLAQYGLLTDAPDFAGAIALLNGGGRRPAAGAPDVSIILPVHGQTPYTLNALDSLFRHATRHSTEIIVVDDASPDAATREMLPRVTGITCLRLEQNLGFIGACNHGGEHARGRFLLLLNNDTRVVAGWLDALIGSFAAFPRAGLVGSKMLFADGSLQEAGSILWRDGTVWNYGRGDDPNRPHYCHARPVDYVSGCSIALPRTLWRQLNGLDTAYAPAYAEDADLCLRVREAGREVWFQPLSRVVHYEGRTSGTSLDEGAKAWQLANLNRLYLQWRRGLEQHRFRGDNAYLERERPVRRRILVVDSVTPTPDQDAGSLQTVLALRCCHMAGYKTHFVPEDNWLYVPGYTDALRAEATECAYAPYEMRFSAYIERYGWLFDAVIVYRVHILARVIDLVRIHAPQAALLFHLADLHYLRARRQAERDGDAGAMAAAARLQEQELELVRRADCTITHSTVERDILAQEVPGAAVAVWPLMMPVVGTEAPLGDRRDVCFLGGFRHPPNEEAVLWFAAEVWPLLADRLPQARFLIAGAQPTEAMRALAGPRIEVLGQVPELAPLFDRCRAFVCPLLVGAGAKGKVASALAHGLPVVSTAIGVEGVGLAHERDVLVADGAEAFADAVLRLYEQEDLWIRLSQAGLARLQHESSLEAGRRTLERAMDTALRHKLALDAPHG